MHTSFRVLSECRRKTSSPAEAGEGEPSSAAKRLAGPAAERGGEVRDRCQQGALIFPISLRETGPFLLPGAAGEDEVRQTPDNIFEHE